MRRDPARVGDAYLCKDGRIAKREYHGMKRSSEYGVWRAMLARCENTKNEFFESYGKRGIRVCERWHSFTAFFADMGARPFEGATIDRKDNDGNYEPSNCLWSTAKMQARNRRNTRWVVFRGHRMSLAEAAEKIGVRLSQVTCRLWRGWTLQRALGISDVRDG